MGNKVDRIDEFLIAFAKVEKGSKGGGGVCGGTGSGEGTAEGRRGEA